MPILTVISDWFSTLSLVFGGCCSNALTLEHLTSQYPLSGSLITFFQFLLISLHGLPKQITWTSYGPRLKPRKIPLTPYLIQVALFYLISMINNAAFAYHIPMSVHIIFRSGGLIVSMVLGWLVAGKKYTTIQVLSVFIVTAGVILTTFSASAAKPTSNASTESTTQTQGYTYYKGIALLSTALIFGGFLGLVQDWTYRHHGRPSLMSPSPSSSESLGDTSGTQEQEKGSHGRRNGTTQGIENLEEKTSSSTKPPQTPPPPPSWRESMFYLHFLGLPMFFSVRHDLLSQFRVINSGPKMTMTLAVSSLPISFPKAYIPLLLNTLTQLLCVAGVHRLTTRVSSLTVTLVLVVRKAVSLVISVLGGGGGGGGKNVDVRMMWGGAALVLLGTIGYSMGSRGAVAQKVKEKQS